MSVIAKLDVLLRGDSSQLESSFKKTQESSSGLGTAVAASFVGMTAAVAAAGAALVAWGVHNMGAINDARKMAESLGMSTESLLGLQYGAQKAGVEAEGLEHALRHMQRAISEAATDGGAAAKALNQLGLSALQLEQMSPEEQLNAMADALSQVQNVGDRTRLTMELFGKSGGRMGEFLKGGSAGLAEFKKQAQALGYAVSDEQAAKLGEASKAWGDFQAALTGMGNSLAVIVGPGVKLLADILKDLVAWINTGITAAMPIMEQFWDTMNAGWDMLKDMGEPILESLQTIFEDLVGSSQGLGLSFENVSNFIIGSLAAVEFSFKHWQNAVEIVIVAIRLAFEGFRADIDHIFTVLIPAIFAAFEKGLSQFLVAFVANVVTNISEARRFILSLGKEGNISFNWINMTSGFAQGMADVADKMKRPMTDLEAELATNLLKLTQQFIGGAAGFAALKLAELAERRKKLEKDAKKNASDIIPTATHPETVLANTNEAFKILFQTQQDKNLQYIEEQTGVMKEIKGGIDKMVEQLIGIPLVKARL